MKPFSGELPFGYCTNVHAGVTLQSALEQIDRHATRVRDRLIADGRLPVGLWFSEAVAEQVILENRFGFLLDWLSERGLTVNTLNGFPQGDFHQSVVKHSVYQPTWNCESRAVYTQRLAQILEALLPEGGVGSISTLPLGWPHAPWHAENFSLAAEFLLGTAHFLHRLSENRGCEIVVAIEPEPGCVLGSATDLVTFFERYLFRGSDAEVARQHLTVCHDICHSGVMFEPQPEALELYHSAGIRVGKVQVSSAVHVPWDEVISQPELQADMLKQVRSFNEPKYLHQTTRCGPSLKLESIVEDLPLAFTKWTNGQIPSRPWRIHFHLPIFLERFGLLATTRSDIPEACEFLEHRRHHQIAGRDWFTGHYEVETYAWPVLPPELAVTDLATGIAQELEYFREVLKQQAVQTKP